MSLRSIKSARDSPITPSATRTIRWLPSCSTPGFKNVGLRNVHPVGHSRGAYLVARLTLEHPELFKTCILVDTNTLAPGISKNETVMANPPLPRLSRRESTLGAAKVLLRI